MSWASFPNELESLAANLVREESTSQTGEFLYQETGRFRHEWLERGTVSAVRLPLPLPRDQGLHPVGCVLQAAFLDFAFQVKDGEVLPALAEYQIKIEGLLLAGEALIQLEDHWRIDTDIYANASKDKTKPAKEPHPFFHFQRGGHAQDEFAGEAGFFPSAAAVSADRDWKGLMQYPGPRIPALPMDPILAIDFCIGQNHGLIWQRLRNFPEYYSLIEQAQARLWLPFFDALRTRELRRRWLGPLLTV